MLWVFKEGGGGNLWREPRSETVEVVLEYWAYIYIFWAI